MQRFNLFQIPHWGICCWMQTVAETPTFTRQADKLFSEDDRRELIDHLAGNPLAGDEIRGTGASESFASRPWAVAREAARE